MLTRKWEKVRLAGVYGYRGKTYYPDRLMVGIHSTGTLKEITSNARMATVILEQCKCLQEHRIPCVELIASMKKLPSTFIVALFCLKQGPGLPYMPILGTCF
jgi:hypothetical protein